MVCWRTAESAMLLLALALAPRVVLPSSGLCCLISTTELGHAPRRPGSPPTERGSVAHPVGRGAPKGILGGTEGEACRCGAKVPAQLLGRARPTARRKWRQGRWVQAARAQGQLLVRARAAARRRWRQGGRWVQGQHSRSDGSGGVPLGRTHPVRGQAVVRHLRQLRRHLSHQLKQAGQVGTKMHVPLWLSNLMDVSSTVSSCLN
jgi:hypothetical protein